MLLLSLILLRGSENAEYKNIGTLHRVVDPRLQPKPSFSRCNGQMIIEFMFASCVNTAARLRISSTSSSGPENPRLAAWLEIGFEQASKGIICASFFLSLVSNPHIPPRLKRTAHLHIHSMTRFATRCIYERFTKPVTE